MLIGEILGVLLAGAALATYIRARERIAAGVALAVVAVASLLFFENASGLVKTFPSSIAANERLAPAAIQDEPAVVAGASTNNPFLVWARDRMIGPHRGFSYWVIASRSDAFDQQWVSYALLPGVARATPGQANWLVFFGVAPSHVAYDTVAFTPPVYYQPGYAIAERRRAS